MIEHIIQWLIDTISALGYPGLVLLMAIESSILPLPSELIMPPAGYLAARGQMSLPLVILAGTLGSMLGALINYVLAAKVGEPFLRRFGKYVLISPSALDRTKAFFDSHGEISTLVGRLLPVIRHLISIPAGLCRMRLGRFLAFTGIGAGIWCTVLTMIGWLLGRHEGELRQAAVHAYTREALIWIIPAALFGIVLYVWWNRKRAGAVAR
ncbi:MAG: DedA family protein [Gemmatimonadota bacterium]